MSGGGPRTRLTRGGVHVLALVVAGAVAGAGAVGAAALVAGQLPGRGSWDVAPVAAAAATGALLWPRARGAGARSVDRIVLGGPRSPEEVVRGLAARAADLPDDEALLDLAAAVRRSFAAVAVELWRSDDLDGLVLTTALPSVGPGAGDPAGTSVRPDEAATRMLRGAGVVGRAWLEMWLPGVAARHPGAEVRAVPITHAEAVLGLLLVTRGASDPRFSAADDAALAELASRLGVVLHNRELDAALRATLVDLQRTNDELRASRVRLVATADAERRRIERDLHDGAQQHLVALAVHLRLAEDAIADDPSNARTHLAELHDELRSAIAELRTLAHGIYPPLLADAGLVEALRVAADRSPSHVALTTGRVGRYAAEVEAAAYFCCLEALQNAAKHAGGAAVRLHVGEVDGVLDVVVEDDGPGVDVEQVRPGHGLGNMADRVGAVGGSLSVERAVSGGARVVCRIPVAADAERAPARAEP